MRSSSTARDGHIRPLFLFCLLLSAVIFALPGCSGKTYPFAKGRKAMARGVANAPPPIYLAALHGAPRGKTARLLTHLVREAQLRNISFAAKPNSKTFRLTGFFSAAPAPQGSALAYVWDISGPKAIRQRRITGEIIFNGHTPEDVWLGVDDRVLTRVARETAERLSGWLNKLGYRVRQAALSPPVMTPPPARPALRTIPAPVARQTTAGLRPTVPLRPLLTAAITPRKTVLAAMPATPKTPATRRAPSRPRPITPIVRHAAVTVGLPKPGLWTTVRPVTGAGSAANIALTRHIRTSLERAGVKIAGLTQRRTMAVSGRVKVGPAMGKNRHLILIWNLYDARGAVIGTVTQRNTVPAAALSGDWGDTARQAAKAAAEGIVKLLPPVK